MTVSYTAEVATSTGLGCFLKLLRRWKGSIYKLVWIDLLLFLGIYYTLNLSYLFLLDDTSKKYFVRIVTYCSTYRSLIPLSFVLGFFVNIVFTRWWTQYSTIPFPDNLAILIGAGIKGHDERSRIIRRTIVRYVCVTFTMTLTLISPKVKKRFPTLEHYVEAGLLTTDERKLIQEIEDEFPSYTKYWLPLAWATSVSTRARHEGFIKDDHMMMAIIDELNTFRSKCGGMLDYDWISIPLVYTQVVTLAVYGFFLVTVIGNQFLEDADNTDVGNLIIKSILDRIIFSFPFMPIIEFFFYVGWLKVAETLINPFGDDDDDFEVMWMIDRHLQICYLLVDRIHQEHPKLVKDAYWGVIAPMSLPFTVASQHYFKEYPESSTKNIHVNKTDQDLILPEVLSKTDSKRPKSASNLWSRNGLFLRGRKSRNDNVPLRRITINEADQTDNSEGELTEKTSQSLTALDNVASDNEDFNRLREERAQQRQEHVLKYIRLLKSVQGHE